MFAALGQAVLGSLRGNSVVMAQTRTKMRLFWVRPSETKRVRKHGWNTRLSTFGGRRIIMNRILRGRQVLTHPG